MATAYFDDNASGNWVTSFVYDPNINKLYMGWYMSHPELVEDLEDHGIEGQPDWVYGQLVDEEGIHSRNEEDSSDARYAVRIFSDYAGRTNLDESEEDPLMAEINAWLARNPYDPEYRRIDGSGVLASVHPGQPTYQWIDHMGFSSPYFDEPPDPDARAAGLKYIFDHDHNHAYVWPASSSGAPHHADQLESLEDQGAIIMHGTSRPSRLTTGYWFPEHHGAGFVNDKSLDHIRVHNGLMGVLAQDGIRFKPTGAIDETSIPGARQAGRVVAYTHSMHDQEYSTQIDPWANARRAVVYDSGNNHFLIGNTPGAHHMELYEAAEDDGWERGNGGMYHGYIIDKPNQDRPVGLHWIGGGPSMPTNQYAAHHLSPNGKVYQSSGYPDFEPEVVYDKAWDEPEQLSLLSRIVTTFNIQQVNVEPGESVGKWRNNRIPFVYFDGTFYIGDDPGGHHYPVLEAIDDELGVELEDEEDYLGFIIDEEGAGLEGYAPYAGTYWFRQPHDESLIEFSAKLSPAGRVYSIEGGEARLLYEAPKQQQLTLFSWSMNPYLGAQVRIEMVSLGERVLDSIAERVGEHVYDEVSRMSGLGVGESGVKPSRLFQSHTRNGFNTGDFRWVSDGRHTIVAPFLGDDCGPYHFQLIDQFVDEYGREPEYSGYLHGMMVGDQSWGAVPQFIQEAVLNKVSHNKANSIPIFPRVNILDVRTDQSHSHNLDLTALPKHNNPKGGTTTLPPLDWGKAGEAAPEIAGMFGNSDILLATLSDPPYYEDAAPDLIGNRGAIWVYSPKTNQVAIGPGEAEHSILLDWLEDNGYDAWSFGNTVGEGGYIINGKVETWNGKPFKPAPKIAEHFGDADILPISALTRFDKFAPVHFGYKIFIPGESRPVYAQYHNPNRGPVKDYGANPFIVDSINQYVEPRVVYDDNDVRFSEPDAVHHFEIAEKYDMDWANGGTAYMRIDDRGYPSVDQAYSDVSPHDEQRILDAWEAVKDQPYYHYRDDMSRVAKIKALEDVGYVEPDGHLSSAQQDEMIDVGHLQDSPMGDEYKFFWIGDEDKMIMWETDRYEAPHHYDVIEDYEDRGTLYDPLSYGQIWRNSDGSWGYSGSDALRDRAFALIAKHNRQMRQGNMRDGTNILRS